MVTTNDGTFKLKDHELWCAMEEQILDMISDKVIQYLTTQAIQHHVDEAIDKYFHRIKEMIDDDPENFIDAQEIAFVNEGFMEATWIAVMLILEDVLPQVHLKPEWKTKKTWEQMVQAKKENTND